ncbi:Hypothetical predicted protein [Octopus vulgaris]|uniref:Uncharacterized protein n=1 Tax=Octopus vulgaris TaxID=6645 RepID=A0AA36ARD5_OCTVU|nr:Hypothetical predicted protein [Octopus vulgaris]
MSTTLQSMLGAYYVLPAWVHLCSTSTSAFYVALASGKDKHVCMGDCTFTWLQALLKYSKLTQLSVPCHFLNVAQHPKILSHHFLPCLPPRSTPSTGSLHN